jgi:Carbohydrate esterase, sialic acid-specific acetylesterase
MNRLITGRRLETWLVLASVLALAGMSACGVVEHPHDVQAIDTSDDFGPLPTAGSNGVPTAGTGSVPVGGTGSVPVGGTGSVPVGGSGTGAAATGGTGTTPGGGAPPAGGSGSGTAGGPPLSGVTITLGGTNVPKEKAIAFIHIGHSNMAGYGRSPQSSSAFHRTETNPRAFMYHAGSPPKLALEPTAALPAATQPTGGSGPGTALVKEAAMAAPDYHFVSIGYGVPSGYCAQFLPGALHYDNLIAASKAIKGRVTFGGIFIYLGITERHGTAADLEGFPNCINTLVTAIRNDVGEPNLPALMNDYEVEGTGTFAVSGTVAKNIMPQIAKCPSVVTNFALVSADDIPMQDDHHFNLDGQRMWAQRALAKMKEKGWSFWAP